MPGASCSAVRSLGCAAGPKAIAAWQRLLAIDENNRRAQDALKKLYVTEGRWEDLEEFYRARGKIDGGEQ